MKWNEYWKGKKGPPISNEHRKKLSESHIGQVAWNKGKKMNKEFCEKISVRQLGKKQVRSEEGKKSFSEKMSGKNHPRWVADRTQLKRSTEDGRRSSAHNFWRKTIWERDSFKCQLKNEQCSGRIEAHHIIGWAKSVELRYEIKNGITLCHAHHPRGRAEEKRLEPKLLAIVSVSRGTKL